MKIAGHTMGTPEYSLESALGLFSQIGLDGAEIIVQNGYGCGIGENASEREILDVKNMVDSAGLVVSCLTPYQSRFNSLDASVREAEIQGIERSIRFSEILGAGYVRIYGGNFLGEESDGDGKKLQALVESMRYLGDVAGKVGVTLVIENHFNTMAVSARQSIGVVDLIDHPSVGILYDQANLAFTYNEDFHEAIKLQGRKIKYVHVKDLVFTTDQAGFKSSSVSHPTEKERNVTSRIVGEGILDWRSIIRELKDHGYDGWLSLEYERRWHPLDIPDASIGMRKGAGFLRTCL